MFIRYDDPAVRLTGRFASCGNAAVATAAGSFIELAFTGKTVVAHFDISDCEYPYPHIWVQIDDGARMEAALDKYLRFQVPDDGSHVLMIIFKSEKETQSRWVPPLTAKLAFEGADADGRGVLPPDDRRTIEFVGDSITQGILIDVDYSPYEDDMNNRCFQDDSTATYAWLTAEKLGLRPLIMGYGAVGATRGGNGGVPKVAVAYPACFLDAPVPYPDPYLIVINHGANDWDATDETYVTEYRLLLDLVRLLHPTSHIVSLSAFCGCHHQALEKMIALYNRETGADVLFIDSTGWVPPEPLHPLRDGHRIIADKLTASLREHFSL